MGARRKGESSKKLVSKGTCNSQKSRRGRGPPGNVEWGRISYRPLRNTPSPNEITPNNKNHSFCSFSIHLGGDIIFIFSRDRVTGWG